MADLSSAAQAVLDAMYQVNMDFSGENAQLAAAALRAVVDQVAKADPLSDTVEDCIRGAEREHMRGKFYTLAAEFDPTH